MPGQRLLCPRRWSTAQICLSEQNPGLLISHSSCLAPVFRHGTQHWPVHFICKSYNSWVKALLPVPIDSPLDKGQCRSIIFHDVSQFPSSFLCNCPCCSAHGISMVEKQQVYLYFSSLPQFLQCWTDKLTYSKYYFREAFPLASVPPLEPMVEQMLGFLQISSLFHTSSPGHLSPRNQRYVTQGKCCISGLLLMLAAGHPRTR